MFWSRLSLLVSYPGTRIRGKHISGPKWNGLNDCHPPCKRVLTAISPSLQRFQHFLQAALRLYSTVAGNWTVSPNFQLKCCDRRHHNRWRWVGSVCAKAIRIPNLYTLIFMNKVISERESQLVFSSGAKLKLNIRLINGGQELRLLSMSGVVISNYNICSKGKQTFSITRLFAKLCENKSESYINVAS